VSVRAVFSWLLRVFPVSRRPIESPNSHPPNAHPYPNGYGLDVYDTEHDRGELPGWCCRWQFIASGHWIVNYGMQ
jgi:hypothetical protein